VTTERRLELAWSEREGYSCLRVRGWTEAEYLELGGLAADKLGRRLALLPSEFVESGADLHALQPIAGRFEVDQDAVCFLPRFPFLDGMSYSFLVHSLPETGREAPPQVWTILRPALEGTPTTDVVAIYPSVDELPVNHLKLYIHFSSPMSEGWAARAIRVRRADNDEPLEGVFLAMEPELWDRERRRLTLLFDPARIKRGLLPHEEAGYPLSEGVPIIVSIDAKFHDAGGRPLRTGAERRYEIGPLLRVRVDPAGWRYQPPTAGSTDPLTVEFDRPLDHALLGHSIWVNDAAGGELAGVGSVGPEERAWRFEPQSPWREDRHVVMVDPRLEDLAGNSVIRVFDRDLLRTEDAPTDAHHVAIDFTCTPPSTPPLTKLTS
jgi:hypothetical protein